METTQIRILIEGRLQSLNFRLNMKEQAKKFNLVGFVRNLSSGRVEIEAQGTPEDVEKLLTWCQEDPHAARIEKIMYRYDDLIGNWTDFTVRR